MQMIATIAAGVALGILVAAVALYASYRNWSVISRAALAAGRLLWNLKWWFGAAAGLALAVFVFTELEAARRRKAVEQARQRQLEESWRVNEERRTRVRAQCDAERKALKERCEPIIAAAEAVRKKGDALRFDKDVFDCEIKLRAPRSDCWLP
jgi:biopolymer transport protein ExbB/TolQ